MQRLNNNHTYYRKFLKFKGNSIAISYQNLFYSVKLGNQISYIRLIAS
jgi:hypothetical protein